MIKIGLLIVVACFVPLILVGLLNPDSNPIGLSLLPWFGSLIGIIVAVIGLLCRSIRITRRRR
jgi:protein-S-isoprenylcysteine O-methyltransferase Ste14